MTDNVEKEKYLVINQVLKIKEEVFEYLDAIILKDNCDGVESCFSPSRLTGCYQTIKDNPGYLTAGEEKNLLLALETLNGFVMKRRFCNGDPTHEKCRQAKDVNGCKNCRDYFQERKKRFPKLSLSELLNDKSRLIACSLPLAEKYGLFCEIDPLITAALQQINKST